MMQDMDISDRMKFYERLVADHKLMPLVPVCARIDGRAFHTFCKGLKRPYDERISKLMAETCKFLVLQSNAKIGYTQSDEISLVWYSDDWKNEIFFDGRVQKMTTQLSALASVCFNRMLPEMLPEKADKLPTFDARVWTVPNLTEAANYILWREQDATKNSISMAAQAVFSHTALHGKSGSEKQEMLWQRGINWNDYPDFFKKGVYFARRSTSKPFSQLSEEEKASLPPKHAARTNPDLVIKRSGIVEIPLPPLGKIGNREAVLFEDAAPVNKEGQPFA
jgi:tRNA(His) guanylyltransferase